MNKFVKILLYIVIGLLVILGISYIVFRNVPKASTKNIEAEVSITATQIFEQFTANEAKATKDYSGKIITVEGTLTDSFTDEQGNPAIIIGNADTDLVFATLYPSEEEKISSMQINDPIKIKGSCTGMLTEVTINKAVIVE